MDALGWREPRLDDVTESEDVPRELADELTSRLEPLGARAVDPCSDLDLPRRFRVLADPRPDHDLDVLAVQIPSALTVRAEQRLQVLSHVQAFTRINSGRISVNKYGDSEGQRDEQRGRPV
jgi:hypothetical protein